MTEYRKDVYYSTSIYTKIHEDQSAIKLEIKEPSTYDMTQCSTLTFRFTLTFIDRYDFDHDVKQRRDIGLILSHNEYALTEDQFYDELRQTSAILEGFFRTGIDMT